MANHCFDVICLDCGREWCERGCGYHAEPDQQRLRDWRQTHHTDGELWCTPVNDARCECGSGQVVMR